MALRQVNSVCHCLRTRPRTFHVRKGGARNHHANRYRGCPEEQIADGKLRFAFDWTGCVPGLLGFRYYLFSMYLQIGSATGPRHIQSGA